MPSRVGHLRFAVAVGMTVGLLSQDPLPAPKTQFLLEGMPSFGQRNRAFHGGGKSYCGPAAASNALLWLSARGYPALRPAVRESASVQVKMIKRLAALMGTRKNGTSVRGFARGVDTYLRKAGYAPKAWISSGHGCVDGVLAPPDIGLVRSEPQVRTVVWLGLGWYRFDEDREQYVRKFGHWVTLVGIDPGSRDPADAPCFVIADPEAPEGYRRVALESLGNGTLCNGRSWAETKGYFQLLGLSGGAAADTSIDHCILESIQGFTIE